jgi:hypothetical protein
MDTKIRKKKIENRNKIEKMGNKTEYQEFNNLQKGIEQKGEYILNNCKISTFIVRISVATASMWRMASASVRHRHFELAPCLKHHQ